jgi:hypothetical protein
MTLTDRLAAIPAASLGEETSCSNNEDSCTNLLRGRGCKQIRRKIRRQLNGLRI